MEIHEIETADAAQIRTIAELHTRAFPQFFLTQLGISFLSTLYRGYVEDENSGIFLAEEQGRLVGFLAYSNNYPQFYKNLIKYHLPKFAACAALAAIRHPSFIKRLLRAFKKSDSVVKQEQYVELASICVEPTAEGKGVGSALIDALKRIVDFEKYAYINLETDAADNERTNRFYVNNGFVLERQYITAEGRKMNEYRFYKSRNRSNTF